MAYVIIWKYCVKSEFVDRFADTYGPDGTWVESFRGGPGEFRPETWLRVGAPTPALSPGQGKGAGSSRCMCYTGLGSTRVMIRVLTK